jgi:hypothetical protein
MWNLGALASYMWRLVGCKYRDIPIFTMRNRRRCFEVFFNRQRGICGFKYIKNDHTENVVPLSYVRASNFEKSGVTSWLSEKTTKWGIRFTVLDVAP